MLSVGRSVGEKMDPEPGHPLQWPRGGHKKLPKCLAAVRGQDTGVPLAIYKHASRVSKACKFVSDLYFVSVCGHLAVSLSVEVWQFWGLVQNGRNL